MEPAASQLTPLLGWRIREFTLRGAGLAAGAALLWAGVTVHDGLRSANEVAVARLSGALTDTVVAEWQRMLRASEPPVAPAGETFRFSVGEQTLQGLDGSGVEALTSSDGEKEYRVVVPAEALSEGVRESASVFWTLLDEAERLELVEHDDEGALELVLEGLEKASAAEAAEGWLRALQLGARLGQKDVVDAQWEHLRSTPIGLGLQIQQSLVPYRVLGWLALPAELRNTVPAATILGDYRLERLCLEDDRLVLGTPDDPASRFELAPMVAVLCERMGLELPPLDRRKTRALAARLAVPAMDDDGRWHRVWLEGLPFVTRRTGNEQIGWFYSTRELQRALVEHAALPPLFVLDFDGDDEGSGVALGQRVKLPDSDYAFTLRHPDPAALGRAERTRLKLLRAALFLLAFVCARSGFSTARLLERQRKLGALKSAFVAGVSHDLRTPLASILLLTENLETGVAGEADRERYHRALRKEATRLRRLVDDVLDFSRLERGEDPRIEREGVELGRFSAELEADSRARVEGEGRAFAFERGALPEVGSLDAHAVRRALENLLDNALKHGSGAVRLSLAAADGRLVLAVSDEGPGVPEAERERVFQPFERLNANGHAGGTGLGLAIVRSIARAHGGEARVRAGAGGAGAAFELDLPLEETHE